MGTKPRNLLKEDVAPTIFKHSQGPSRKSVYLFEIEKERKRERKRERQRERQRETHTQRETETETERKQQAKEQFLQEALGTYEKTITQSQKEVSCFTKYLIAVTETAIQTVQIPNQFRCSIEKNILGRGFKILRKYKPLS